MGGDTDLEVAHAAGDPSDGDAPDHVAPGARGDEGTTGSLAPDRSRPTQTEDCSLSFQAYLDNIKAKTGRSPDDFKRLAAKKGFRENGKLRDGITAGEIVAWLKEDFELGHGHAMAVVARLKGSRAEQPG